jgi:serine/threonine protein kinase
MYMQEASYMSVLSGESWAPKLLEMFVKQEGMLPCIAIEELGQDLEKIRLAYPEGQHWSWVTIGSIGARMLEIVETLHKKYDLVHTDLHAGNWVLTKVSGEEYLSPELKLIDFGDCRPLEADGVLTRDFYAFSEVRQVIITLRYLFDGNFTFYAWKRYNFKEQEICNGIHPEICKALVYVHNLEEGDEIDYRALREMMVKVVEESGDFKYTGNILWGPVGAGWRRPGVESHHGKPKLATKRPFAHSTTDKHAVTTGAHQLDEVTPLPPQMEQLGSESNDGDNNCFIRGTLLMVAALLYFAVM